MKLTITFDIPLPAGTEKETLAIRHHTAQGLIDLVKANLPTSSAENPYKAERAKRKAKNDGEAPANAG